jgi:pimeloyl-ACP methyl ester carboxylesterase
VPQKYVRVDGVATFVHHVGPTTLPERPPALARGETVVCLHGAATNAGEFADLLPRLEAAHSPLAFDQPGHARSGGLDSLPSIARMSEFTRAFCAAFRIEKCVLLGTSMGGCVALETALAAPALVRGLVLVASRAKFSASAELLERLRLITEGKARREFDRSGYSPAATPDVMRKGFMEELKTDPRVLYGSMQAMNGWNREADLARVACPTLVVVGEDDSEEVRARADVLAAGVRGARKVVIPKSGHRVALEQPEALANEVGSFLSGLAR